MRARTSLPVLIVFSISLGLALCLGTAIRVQSAWAKGDDWIQDTGLVSANELIEHAISPGMAETKDAALKTDAWYGSSAADALDPPPSDKYSAVLRQYRLSLKKRITHAWFPPKDVYHRPIVRFSLSRSGAMSNLSLVQTSRLGICDKAVFSAVIDAQPLPAIPKELPAPLEAVCRFAYDRNRVGVRLYSTTLAEPDTNTNKTTSGFTKP